MGDSPTPNWFRGDEASSWCDYIAPGQDNACDAGPTYSSSFLTQCRSVTVSAPEHGHLRCELVRRHDGPHRRERGMYDIAWTDRTWTL